MKHKTPNSVPATAGARVARAQTAALLLGAAGLAHAQTLPPPLVSPAPVTQYEYDAEGNPTKTVVAPATRALSTRHAYDSLSRRTSTTDAKAGVTQFGYDLLDQLTSVTDPRALATQYQPTGLGDVRQLTSPDTGITASTYDAAGNLKTRTDARGVLASYGYDELSRIKYVVYSKAGSTNRSVSWTYDQTGTSFGAGIGRLTTAATADANTTFRYDALGRVVGTSQATSVGGTRTVSYAYDAAGNITSMTYPSGRLINFVRVNGQVRSINKEPPLTPFIDQIVMNANGQPESWVWSFPGSTPRAHQRVYDTNGRLVRHSFGNLVRDITYDDADRISRYTHYVAATAQPAPNYDQAFSYDELGRLTNVTAATNWSYTYDANGNRKASAAGSVARGYTVAATSNRLDALTNPARSMVYNPDGTTLSDTQSGSGANYTATYSLEGRLASMTQGSTAGVEFGYDAMGRRVWRSQWTGSPTNPRTITLYAYDLENHLIGEYKVDGSPIYEYIWLGDIPVVAINLSGNEFAAYAIHTDHLNTPRMLLEPGGALRWRWLGEPFGASPAEEQPTAARPALKFNLRFPGQQYEAFGGRFYNHFRDYDPTTGRYVQSDPIGLGGGVNTYAYVDGSPIDTVDPTGEFGIAGALWGGGIDLGLQLIMNGGKLKCVNWKDVGLAAAGGALGSGLLSGIGKIKNGVNNWNATTKWLRRSNGPGGPYTPVAGQRTQYHHWLIEQNSTIGKLVPDFIKNQPWNLNPIPKATHDLIHGIAPGGAQYGFLMRWWQGTPGWAKGVEAGLGAAVFAPGDQGADCECQ